jgi:hypothetical protein
MEMKACKIQKLLKVNRREEAKEEGEKKAQ